MIIDSIRTFLKSCPLLKGNAINVNYLGDTPVKYSIDIIPCLPVIKKYIDGGTLRQYQFSLSSREAYDENALENMKVAQFFEEFEEYIEQQNEVGNLPKLSDEKLTPIELEIMSTGFLSSQDGKTARFEVDCRLIYRRDL